MDAASDSATGAGVDAASRDATVHPRDAGRDATLVSDAGSGSDATSADASTPPDAPTCDDESMDVLSTSDAQVDAESDGTVVSDAGVACLSPDAGLGGIGVPAGTVATASGSYLTQTPEGVITGTGWNAGAFSGWIELTFAAPVTLDGIQLVAGADPTATETYTLTGFQGSTSVSLGSWTDTVEGNCQCAPLLPPMLFAAGSYDAIQIAVNGGASWVAINQISLLTSSCPGSGDAGTPDSGNPDSGMQGEAGAPDAKSPTDAAEASAEASVCNLGVVAATPIPPLAGTVTVTGTEGVPGGPVLAGGCQPFVTGTTSGTLTFSITSVGCYISYLDASGLTYTSTINAPMTFDGDKYTCIYQYDPPAGPQTYAACPELDNLQNDLNATVLLSVTRSTGAVSLSRLCSAGEGCTVGPGEGTRSTQFGLNGSLSCADVEDGGSPYIVCGTSTCAAATQFCCAQLSDGGTGCLDNSYLGPCRIEYDCSGPESCPLDNVCCTTPVALGVVATCQAGTTCPQGTMTVCGSDEDCPDTETCTDSNPGICGSE
jgi:hypothetical protein